ncbi:uncharacterized protein LOC120160903 [Hibiscus syriacus]|uniref:uncharacterized protein LOC120160903 n=1 Tax=Hibiscus syriacus TaxID=106335 RepID=UPI0019224D25|nr:uncharacterized protein LOC120160903 [Hibiscus syriacus]
MVFLDRLATKERLNRMGIIIDCHCIFCGAVLETRNHLFFDCSVAASLWSGVYLLNGLRFRHPSWDALFAWVAASWKGKSLLTSIIKIASNALIYTIWQERNKRLFQGRSSTVEEMFYAIKEIVGLHLMDRPINRIDNVNIILCNKWGIV